MTRGNLRHGYTTGTCAAAAAKGAALLLASQELVKEVDLTLPAGVSATLQIHGQFFTTCEASCHVIKDAGDDPDVTNGAEVHARVTFISLPPTLQEEGRGGDGSSFGSTTNPSGKPRPHPNLLPEDKGINSLSSPPTILITGGIGIGRVTKPGLAVPPGEWAINPVPRRMIEDALAQVFPDKSLNVEISIPDGEQLARKTLNARLGIIGGLSILGTTGIVRPISAKAWTDTIDAALDVARACGAPTVILSTGRSSEMAAQKGFSSLPEEAFVMMGDHVAHSLRACAEHGFAQPLIACQFAKLLKIACGHENTHAAASELDLADLRQWAEAEFFPTRIIEIIRQANTAREVILASGFDHALLELVCKRAQAAANRTAPSLRVKFQVADYSGNIVFHSR